MFGGRMLDVKYRRWDVWCGIFGGGPKTLREISAVAILAVGVGSLVVG